MAAHSKLVNLASRWAQLHPPLAMGYLQAQVLPLLPMNAHQPDLNCHDALIGFQGLRLNMTSQYLGE